MGTVMTTTLTKTEQCPAVHRQVVHNHVDELVLVRRRRSARQELTECVLRRLPGPDRLATG